MKLIIQNGKYTYEQVIKEKNDLIEGLKMGVGAFVPDNYDGDGTIMLKNNSFKGLVRMLSVYHPHVTAIYYNHGMGDEEIRRMDEKIGQIAKELFTLLDKVYNYEFVDDIVEELDNFNRLFRQAGVDACYKIEE